MLQMLRYWRCYYYQPIYIFIVGPNYRRIPIPISNISMVVLLFNQSEVIAIKNLLKQTSSLGFNPGKYGKCYLTLPLL